jgi:glycosyltransferase involved in cell wall biosynthesis
MSSKVHRVLIISSNSSARGGGERYLVYLALGLLNLGIEVHVLMSTLSYMDGWAADLEATGATVHRLRLKGLAQRRLRFVSAMLDRDQAATVSRFCKTLTLDAILVNQQYDEDGVDYLQGALNSGVAPVVVGVMHMPMTATKNKRPLGRWRGILLRRWYARHSYRLILVSEGAQAEFEAYYTHPRPTYVVNNAVPLDLSDSGQTASMNSHIGHPLVIGFVGQFVAQKNLGCLIAAWRMLGERGIKTNLRLVGDGPDRADLERQLTAIGAPGTWAITGWTSQPETMLRGMNVFVMSSHFEGLPLSLVEAAARGITCVVTPFNGARDVAKHAPWVHIAGGHSELALVHALEKVLSNGQACLPVPPEQIESFRAHFSIHRMATEVAAIMEISPCMS